MIRSTWHSRLLTGWLFLLLLALPGRSQEASSPTWRKLDQSLTRLSQNALPSETEKKLFQERLAELQKQSPGQPIAFLWDGEDHFRSEQYDQAKTAWTSGWKAIASSQGNPARKEVALRLAIRLGQLALQQDRLDEAEKWAQAAIDQGPDSPLGYELLVQTGLRSGRVLSQRTLIEDAVKKYADKNPGFNELYFRLLTDLGENDEVWTRAQKLLKQDSLDPVAHYFLADQYYRQGKLDDAAWHALVAVHNGSANKSLTLKAAKRADRLISNAERQATGNFQALAIGYMLCARSDLAEEALDWLKKAKPTDPWAQLIHRHASATAHTKLDQLEPAEKLWKSILDDYPNNIPALVGLAEIIEAKGGQEEADRLFHQAHQRTPDNGRVRQITRIGGKVALSKDGIKIVSVEPDGPLSQFGLSAGDEVLSLDQQDLSKMRPFKRLKKARQFQGGFITFRNSDGKKITRETELILFPY